MLESRPEDALVKLVKTANTACTAHFARTAHPAHSARTAHSVRTAHSKMNPEISHTLTL